MGQDERELSEQPDGKDMEQEGGAPVPGRVAGAGRGLARGAASSEQEGDSGAGDAGCYAAAGLESDEEEDDAEEALTEELEMVAPVGNAGRGDALGSGRNEDPATIYFELRGFRPTRRAVAHAMPPSSYRRLPLRSRKQYNPTRFIFAVDAASGIANAHDPGTSEAASVPLPVPTASLGSTSATSRSAGVSAAANAGHGAKNKAMVSTAGRSEIDVAVDEPCSDNHNTESNDAGVARASSSCRHPSRSRKQRRPDRCISDPEQDAGAAAAARAKARRGGIVLDRFLTYLGRTSPEQRPEWVRNVTADDVGVQGQRGSNVPRTVSGDSPEGPPDGSRILAIIAILGASLALSLVSCVLIYFVGQRTASGLSDTHQNK